MRADALHLVVLERLVHGDLAPGEALSLLPDGLRQRLERAGQPET